jgi:hypothetical protein
VTWETFFDLGGIAGLGSLVWQGVLAARRYGSRPVLHVRPFDKARDLDTWRVDNSQLHQKVLTLEVKNLGKRLAKRCVATLNVLAAPPGVRLRDTSMTLHWAGTSYINLDTGAHPVDIGAEPRRLDVVFTRNTAGSSGAWVAVPLALSQLNGAPQFHLPPGRYDVEVVITCEDGAGCRVGLTIESPAAWNQLAADRVS